MGKRELKQKLFEVIFTLDTKSAGKDYVALRRLHYSNIEWLQDNALQDEYYQYFVGKLKESKNDETKV